MYLLSYNIPWGQYGCIVSWYVFQVCLCVDFLSMLVPCGQYGGMVGWATGMCYKCVCVLVEAARGNVSA